MHRAIPLPAIHRAAQVADADDIRLDRLHHTAAPQPDPAKAAIRRAVLAKGWPELDAMCRRYSSPTGFLSPASLLDCYGTALAAACTELDGYTGRGDPVAPGLVRVRCKLGAATVLVDFDPSEWHSAVRVLVNGEWLQVSEDQFSVSTLRDWDRSLQAHLRGEA